MLDHEVDQGTVVGAYRIEGILGYGGMGTVFRARHVESGRVVALKLLNQRQDDDGERGARLRSEARAQASLDHRNVVTIYEAGESEAGPYIAMRLIDGPRLVDLVRGRALDMKRSLALLGQVADALDAAHAAGLVHRDVKPHNVLVGEGDHAYLADFGLTRAEQQAGATVTGGLVGTVAYLAPEVVRGGDATPASDRYAFAAMAFNCLTGTVVFQRASDSAVLFAHVTDPPPRISVRRPELGSELDAIFERALAKKPAERQATAGELIRDIATALERAGALELPPPPPAGAGALTRDATDPALPSPGFAIPGPRSGRRTVAMLALAALAGAAVVAAAWALVGGDEGKPAASLPPPRPGLTYVGADLGGPPGRPLDCRGRAPRFSSPSCTVAQATLPGATVVVPHNGVIRQWSVRGARGELALVVLRPRDGIVFQVTLSPAETVGSADVQTFAADVDVERGDRIGLVVTQGSAVGTRGDVAGARIDRWLPPVAGNGRPADRNAGAAFDSELLLRVGILPGRRRSSPPQVTGSAAERLPEGRTLRRVASRLGGEKLDIALVDVGGQLAIDAFTGKRRLARIQVRDVRRGAEVVRFVAAVWAPDQVGLDLSTVEEGSARIVPHGYVIGPSGFLVIR